MKFEGQVIESIASTSKFLKALIPTHGISDLLWETRARGEKGQMWKGGGWE